MKKLILLISVLIIYGCVSKVEVKGGDKFIKEVSGFECKNASIDDYGCLYIRIDATSKDGYDYLAEQFFDQAESSKVENLKSCLIIDDNSNKCVGRYDKDK